MLTTSFTLSQIIPCANPRDRDSQLTLSEYLGISEEELISRRSHDPSLQRHIDTFMRELDTNRDMVLSSDEVRAWVSDHTRHLRDKTKLLLSKMDVNKNGFLDIELEIMTNVEVFAKSELTDHGKIIFQRDEF